MVTTDFFGFDTSDDHFHLQGLGDVSEMGDAILGLVAQEMGDKAPRWLAIRNVSDPQIKAEGTLKQQEQLAAQIYKGFGPSPAGPVSRRSLESQPEQGQPPLPKWPGVSTSRG